MFRPFLVAVVLAASTAAYGEGKSVGELSAETSSPVMLLQDADFLTFISEGYAVVDFFAHWCPPCRRTLPEFEKVAGTLEGIARFGKLNVDGSAIASQVGIRVIPTIALFKDGVEVGRRQGAVNAESLEKWILALMEEEK